MPRPIWMVRVPLDPVLLPVRRLRSRLASG